jgi:membrane protein implicated in regulation of membrane protease activity
MSLRRSFEFYLDKYIRAVGVAFVFLILMFGGVALLGWAKSYPGPFWFQLILCCALAVVLGVAWTKFLEKAPNRF